VVEARALAAWRSLEPDAAPSVVWALEPSTDRVAVLLGAFDPPTSAHVEILAAAARVEGASPVWCLTKVLLARGDRPLLTEEQRVGILVALASRTSAGFAMANRGTYLDTHRAFASDGYDATFVIGSDKLSQLADPSFYEDGDRGVRATFSEARFLVVPRAGIAVDRDDVAVLDPAEVFAEPWTADLSATDVRKKVARAEPFDHLVPPEVVAAVEGYTAAR
jgi:nicotinic acid mononucleotide adenylyltransferase